MGRATTEALALRRTPFGDTSQIVEFLTKDRGRVSIILKGVHRPKARKGGAVDLLDHSVITYFSRRGSRSLAQLAERRVLSHHPVMRRRTDLLLAGEYLVELLRALAPEGQRVLGIYHHAQAYLEALEANPSPESLPCVVFALQGGMLRLTGFELVLDRCVSCDQRPSGRRTLRCDPERGGVVCMACRTGEDHSIGLTTSAAEAILSFRSLDPRRAEEISIPSEIAHQMKRYYDRALLHVMERPIRCHVLPESV